jgi:hypothetical protein
MTHLTEAEFVDLMDGVLPVTRAAHVTNCDTCRSQADAMRALLSQTAAVEVPEPSPLFWSHLSENVRQAIAEQPIERGSWFDWLRPGRGWPAAAALATLVLVVGIWRAMPTPILRPIAPVSPLPVTPSAGAVTATGSDTDIDDDIDADEAWALVRSVADDVPWDQTHDAGISARPGSAERIALQLTPAERKELARLLEDELKRRGA